MVFGVTKNADLKIIEFMISYNEEKSRNEKCVPLYPKWVQTFFLIQMHRRLCFYYNFYHQLGGQ